MFSPDHDWAGTKSQDVTYPKLAPLKTSRRKKKRAKDLQTDVETIMSGGAKSQRFRLSQVVTNLCFSDPSPTAAVQVIGRPEQGREGRNDEEPSERSRRKRRRKSTAEGELAEHSLGSQHPLQPSKALEIDRVPSAGPELAEHRRAKKRKRLTAGSKPAAEATAKKASVASKQKRPEKLNAGATPLNIKQQSLPDQPLSQGHVSEGAKKGPASRLTNRPSAANRRRQAALDALQGRMHGASGIVAPRKAEKMAAEAASNGLKQQQNEPIRAEPGGTATLGDPSSKGSKCAIASTLPEESLKSQAKAKRQIQAIKVAPALKAGQQKKGDSRRAKKAQTKGPSPDVLEVEDDRHNGEANSGLMAKLSTRLSGSRFRWLNETFYTSKGADAFALMRDQPELFILYHQGFQQQVKSWPQQPVEAAIKWLKTLPASLRVADFGCGDAALALAVPQKVACLDLVATKPGIIACNMSKTPLETGSMDVAVFCLALMGTDYPAFLREATRVLGANGRLWIAEVRSRFAGSGREDFRPFLSALASLGYKLQSQDTSNKMFVVFQMQKAGPSGTSKKASWPELKPCLYKKR